MNNNLAVANTLSKPEFIEYLNAQVLELEAKMNRMSEHNKHSSGVLGGDVEKYIEALSDIKEFIGKIEDSLAEEIEMNSFDIAIIKESDPLRGNIIDFHTQRAM